jgi:translocator protein
MKNIIKLTVSLGIGAAASAIGSLFTTPAINTWYAGINKSPLTPPGPVFGIVWTILFLLMGISLYLVWKKNWEIILPENKPKTWNRLSDKLLWGEWRKINVVLVFAAQLILNVLWSYIFFAREAPGAAFFELLMLWVAIAYTIANFARISKTAAYLLVPYILWVSFAGYLNFAVWQLNP